MKRILILVLISVLLLSLCACAEKPAPSETVPATAGETGGKETVPVTEKETEAPTEAPIETEEIPETTVAPFDNSMLLNVYSLKGPTTMGFVTVLDDSEQGKTLLRYESTVCTAADEVTAAIVSGKADIAMLPANAAAALYNKAGGFSVIAINTLGVLYVVENGDTVESVEDLAGKTICLTGKGTTPEYSLRYLLAAYGIEDQVTLEFKSEAQEVIAAMAADVAVIGLLPQPFVTAAMAQNENLRIALDLNSEWDTVSADSSLVTGVTVARTELIEEHPDIIRAFLKDASVGVDEVVSNPERAGQLIADLGIVAKAPIAQKAISFCNLVCITDEGMKDMLSGYLQTLYDQNPKAVGEKMPDDSFYYVGE